MKILKIAFEMYGIKMLKLTKPIRKKSKAFTLLFQIIQYLVNSQLATRNSQLATRNSQLATRNSQLATRNSQLTSI
ncbi:hypothetical protein AUR67_10865 [Pseudoalteromonas sp. XI10]|nr:hypothetical protein AUR67_10865 [Pseudoalteromonas sp. XI10]